MNRNTDNIVSGPVLKTIISLASPVMLGMFMQFALSATDFFWVGKLGAAAQDALTSSMVVIWTVFAASSIISVGIAALVARYVGAGDLERATFYTKQGLLLTTIIGLVVTLIGYYLTPTILRFMGTGPTTLALAIPYLRIFFVSSILLLLAETIYAAFRASGDTRTPMVVGLAAIILNLVLDPVLIFGFGTIPAMGVTGASLATAVAFLLAVTLITWRMLSGKLGFEVGNVLTTSPHWPSILKIARIGLPIASQQLVFICVYWFLIRIVHEFGETAGAAMGIGNRMEALSYLTCFGISVAASTLVGQNLGAGNPERAARCAWGATWLGIGLTLVITVFLLTIPRVIGDIFTDDPAVLAIVIDYLIILGLSQSAMAVEIILEGAFSGSGDTVPPMVVAIPGSIARIPLAYLLAFTLDWGINGVWWTLTITTVIKAAVLAYWFNLGRWKSKKV